MKFCGAHWTELREAIDARGLGPLVSTSGTQAAARDANRLSGSEAGKDYDPLMAAHWAIVNRALSIAGLVLMSPNDDGTDRCPLCFLITSCECTLGEGCHYRGWITSVADFVREEAKQKGLLVMS